jgi:general stress protein YciG
MDFLVNTSVILEKPVTTQFICLFFIIYLANVLMASNKSIIRDVMVTKESKGDLSVKEAGRRGGNMTKKRHGHEFYEKIGHKGGQKVKELIARGKSAGK